MTYCKDEGAQFGTLGTRAFGATGFMACPTSKQDYQVLQPLTTRGCQPATRARAWALMHWLSMYRTPAPELGNMSEEGQDHNERLVPVLKATRWLGGDLICDGEDRGAN